MNTAQKMFEVRNIRKQIDKEMDQLEELCGTEVARSSLVTDWRRMEALTKLIPALKWSVSRLRDAEREALELQREEAQMKSVFSDGELCP